MIFNLTWAISATAVFLTGLLLYGFWGTLWYVLFLVMASGTVIAVDIIREDLMYKRR